MDVKFGGQTAQPSEYACPDGDLALSLNLINEEGSVKPIREPSVIGNIGPGYQMFIHKAGTVANYITYRPATRSVQWAGTQAEGLFPEPIPISFDQNIGKIVSIASVGYILIISTDSNLFYVRYNANTNSYVVLGSRLPEIKLDLALKLNFLTMENTDVDLEVARKGDDIVGGSTPAEEWQSVFSYGYNLDTREDGSCLSHANYPYDSGRDRYVASDYIYFDPSFVIKPGIEMKFKWENVVAKINNTTITVYGRRNGSSQLEIMFNASRSDGRTQEIVKTFSDEWSGICFKIWVSSNISDSELQKGEGSNWISLAGNITFFKGVDNSDAGADDMTVYIKYTPENLTGLMGVANKFINQKATEKSKFVYPFFIRYAFRLYDGSYAYVSEPILMVPNSRYVPAINYFRNDATKITRLVLSAFGADIRYRAVQRIPEEWEDLFSSVDVFVSAPIWLYNEGQEFDPAKNVFKFKTSVESYGYGKAYLDNVECDGGAGYARLSLSDYIKRYASSFTNYFVEVSPFEEADVYDKVKNEHSFYKVASIDYTEFNKAADSFADLEIEKGILNVLAARQPLADSQLPLSYPGFKNAYLKSYNNRLHLCSSSVILPPPAHPGRCFNYQDTSPSSADYSIKAYVFLATEDGQKVVTSDISGVGSGSWFFYPDSRAYKAVFVRCHGASVEMIAEVALKKHEYLNGAYWFGEDFTDYPAWESSATDPYSSAPADNSVAALSSIYVSESNCPFVFLPRATVSVGAQKVVALESAAKALSQGQFGQFPLYAFSNEGIWALSVAVDGTYAAVQPIVRDETINIASITQIDSAVLFASKRGIMLLAGSETQCISDYISDDTPFEVSSLHSMDSLHSMIGHKVDKCIPTAPFSSFLKTCRMFYDYTHQRIYAYSASYSYAYVFSLESKLWGLVYSKLRSNVNSYPDAYAVDSDSNVVDFSSNTGAIPKGLLVTRPLKLGAPDIHKTISAVIQRGHFRKGAVQTVLYGSRDLFSWHLIWSSKDHYLRGFRGTPYKYFRLALVCSLQEDESLSGASIEFQPRLTNSLR